MLVEALALGFGQEKNSDHDQRIGERGIKADGRSKRNGLAHVSNEHREGGCGDPAEIVAKANPRSSNAAWVELIEERTQARGNASREEPEREPEDERLRVSPNFLLAIGASD